MTHVSTFWIIDILPGNLRSLNELARSARADYIIHTGDFGFYDDTSLERIAEKYVHIQQAYLRRVLVNY